MPLKNQLVLLLKAVIIVLLLTGFSNSKLYSQVKVDGHIYLENKTYPDSIKVKFEPSDKSPEDSCYSDSNGYFTCMLDTGFYFVTYSYAGYFYKELHYVYFSKDSTLAADTLYLRRHLIPVPEIIPTINMAIVQAEANDTILILPGIYYENLNIEDKPLLITSKYLFQKDTSFITSTVIDGQYLAPVIELYNMKNGFQVSGISLKNGTKGGLNAYYSIVNFEHLKIDSCEANLLKLSNCNASKISHVQLNAGNKYGLLINNSKNIWIRFVNCSNTENTAWFITKSENISADTIDISDGFVQGINVENTFPLNINFLHINNILPKNNSVPEEELGVGINATSSKVFIQNSSLVLNHYAVRLTETITDFVNCQITDNKLGISINGVSTSNFINCYIANNHKTGDDLLKLNNYTTTKKIFLNIYNSIITNSLGYGVSLDDPYGNGYQINIRHSVFYNNSRGDIYNLSDSLLLRNAQININGDSCDYNFNLHKNPAIIQKKYLISDLDPQSPCMDAGENIFNPLDVDFYGHSRIVSGKKDSNIFIDIGPVEHIYSPIQISGKIKSKDQLMGWVILFEMDSSGVFRQIDSVLFNSDGYYQFDSLEYKIYTIRAMADAGSPFYDNYLPTYYGNGTDKSKAKQITASGNNYNIKLIPLIHISGVVIPVGKLFGKVYLFKEQEDTTFVLTDSVSFTKDGLFEFKRLRVGTYKLLGVADTKAENSTYYFPSWYPSADSIQKAKGITESGSNYNISLILKEILAGKVIAGSQSSGWVYLIKQDSNFEFTIEDSSYFDTDGNYLFNYFNPGNYLLQGRLESTSFDFEQYAPSYAEDALLWQKAQIISERGSDYNITLPWCSGTGGGPGKINGHTVKQFSSGSYTVAPNILLILTDLAEHPVAYTYSGNDGTFGFTGLHYGKYLLHVEIAGKTNFDLLIEIKDGKTDYTDLLIQVDPSSSVTKTPAKPYDIRLLSSNLATESIELACRGFQNQYIKVRVFSMQGAELLNENWYISSSIQKIVMSSKPFKGGMYLLIVESIGEMKFREVFKLVNPK